MRGFRLPMLEYEEDSLDIRDQIVMDPDNTFYMLMSSNDMAGFGIFKDNILVIDRSLEPINSAIVVAYFRGEFYTRQYIRQGKSVQLKGDNEAATLLVEPDEELKVWGVVTVTLNRVLPDALRKGRYQDVCTC